MLNLWFGPTLRTGQYYEHFIQQLPEKYQSGKLKHSGAPP